MKDRICCFWAAQNGASRDLPVQDGAIDGETDRATRESPVYQSPGLKLNQFGFIVESQIKWLANQYPYIEIHNYVVMPDHVHLIIEIDRSRVKDEELKIKSLSSLIGALKTTSSKLIHGSGFENFVWQRSFHDSIIRNSKAYYNISRYIDLNPKKWIDKQIK
ncbi:transposase [Paucihalobacter ruber]|uniref:transposase n=1 Tax=Paucihalobacter ruber TaxID=2567861 RepID=UPI001FE40F9E